jgi:hypothetical protein
MKKAMELEQLCVVMKQQQLEEAQEKESVPQDMQLRRTNKKCVKFQDIWVEVHSCSGVYLKI